jgi:hypothetical protein
MKIEIKYIELDAENPFRRLKEVVELAVEKGDLELIDRLCHDPATAASEAFIEQKYGKNWRYRHKRLI